VPSYSFERKCEAPVAGVDEAGRGPLAGPVVAAAVILDRTRIKRKILGKIDDSKTLAKPVREEICAVLMAEAVVGIGAASAAEIDRINIHHATLLAMRRALLSLHTQPRTALVDGKFAPLSPCAVKTIVDGDALCLSIAAASIVAKVTRDRIMARLAILYPGFGFDHNAGYATPEHLLALEAYGPTPHHRRSFEPVINILSRQESLPLGV
jgi:ribonuclease HII